MKMKKGIKRGRLSAEEKKQIEILCETKSDEDIAKQMRRPVETVTLYRIEYLTNNPGLAGKKNQGMELREGLRNHYKWASFKEQFNADELIMFENMYVDLMGQFDGNVQATELNQIFQAITLEIFMARHNRERKETQDDIDRLKRMVATIYQEKSPDEMTDADKKELLVIEGNIQALRQTTQSKTKEYKDLSDKYSDIMKQLKGTREQRISRIENSKTSFLGIIKMLEEEELRNRIGTDMVLMQHAVDKEQERLSEYHTYMNGDVTFPLYTPENIEKAHELEQIDMEKQLAEKMLEVLGVEDGAS